MDIGEKKEEVLHVLSIGYRADATDADLREMTRAADPVGEMTRQLREAQAVCQPLPVPDVMKSLREDGIAARIPESVASIPRNPAAYLPESALDKARSGSRRGSIEAAQYPGGALEAALRDMHRLKRLTGL